MVKRMRAMTKTVSTGAASVESLVQKARAQHGVERILVVYDRERSAQIYVEGEPAQQARPRPPQERAQ